ncbi:MAG TPA: FAD-dependent oxidoreductase [Ruminiclostridium sp.]|nr:FAD-dependent oxidoreductase [Ruminiclostridium sp.]
MICPNLLYSNEPRPPQPDNPTNEQRQTMARYALYRECHPEDYYNILNAFSPPEDITAIAKPGQFKGKRIGIIGGGLAGMSAAFELRKLGFDITIFEASGDRIGGRVYTYYFDREKKLYGELGPMRIPVNHETVWHYINLFRLNTRPFIQSDPETFIYLHQRRVRNDPFGKNVMNYIYPTYALAPWETKVPWQELGYYGMIAPLLEAPPAARSEIIRIKPGYSRQLLFWDSLSSRQMFQYRGLSQGAINLLSNFYPIGGEFLYHNYVDFIQEYFPVNFWFVYEITGGMVNLPLSFHRSFTSNAPWEYYPDIPSELLGKVTWKQGVRVRGIYRCPENGKVTLSFDNSKVMETGYENFDYIICAIPFSVLRTLEIAAMFSSLKMQAIKEVTYGNAQKTAVNCSRRFWEEQGIFGGSSYTDLPVTAIWYTSSRGRSQQSINQKSGVKSPGVILGSYNFNLDAVRLGNMTEEDRIDKIKRNLEEVHGFPKGYLDSIVTGYKTQVWDNDPLFRGAFCYLTPEQKKLFSWVMTLPEYENRVFFAGEHVSAIHRWQQGALKSGMEAANAVARAGGFTN